MDSYKIYPAHPDWQTPNMSLFEEHYDQIVRISYSLRDPQPKLITVRPVEMRRCALCYVTDKKKFSQIAHLLPATLGNRHYTSYEECDKCNNDYGKAYENALANMLSAERAFYRVRTRKGTAKLQPKGTSKNTSPEAAEEGYSYIGGGRYDEQLHIHINKSDESVTSQDRDASSLVIAARNPSYSSTNALKSILKSFWLSINDSSRKKFGYIRKYLINDPTLPRFQSEFFKYFISDAPDAVVFEAWQKKAVSTEQTSELVVRLSIAHTSIVWCSPETSTLIHGPSLLPPLILNEPVTSLDAVKVLCLPEKSVIKAHDIHFSVTYNSRIRLGDDSSPDKDPIDNTNPSGDSESTAEEDEKDDLVPSIPVSLEASSGNICKRIEDTKIITYRLDAQFAIFRILGGTFAAKLFMQVDLDTHFIAFREDYKFHLYPASIASDTIDLLMLAYQPGAQLKAVIKDTTQSLFSIPFFRGQEVPKSLPLYHEMLAHLRLINSSLETDFRIGRQLFSLDLQVARRLVRVISEGYEDRPTQGIHFEMEKGQCEKLKAHLEGNPDKKHLTVRQPNYFADFMNEQIDLGPIRVVLDSPKIDNVATPANTDSEGETSVIWLRSTKTTVYYDRWMKAEGLEGS